MYIFFCTSTTARNITKQYILTILIYYTFELDFICAGCIIINYDIMLYIATTNKID